MGAPSLRDLGRIANRRRTEPLPASTTSEVLAGKRLPRLPRLEFVESYVGACLTKAGLPEEHIADRMTRWRDAWLSLAESKPSEAPPPSPAPARRRRLGRGWVLVAAAFAAGALVGSAGIRSIGTPDPAGTLTALDPAGTLPASAEQSDACEAPGPAATGRDALAGTPPWWTDKADLPLDAGDRAFGITVRPGTSRPGDLIVVKSAVRIETGRRYVLTFTARADRPASFRVRVQDNDAPHYVHSIDRDLPVDTQNCHHRYEFTGGKTSAQSELTFQLGGQPHEFHLNISAVTLVEID
ncbi:carbohydrate binding domain-containing protein [Catenuloplanes atrovinosus]|uniref:CBM-cenC domain-containing protein n=1 Tax=Catenuloplanes atrovinosus TaxID=137266 RepID=A0AAE4CD11_9ACTN|nr:carbohydrate binding domain-containing protein [Catenuloplanes atrovinosus]MDR7277065.1 hypothetical protein [Catenuloplanes atrovinosus]